MKLFLDNAAIFGRKLAAVFLALAFASRLFASDTNGFNGRPWNISSGNLSVSYIQHSPVGAYPLANYFEAPPSVESQVDLKTLGLVANEDYVGWGAVERSRNEWNWKQHDAMEHALHRAGLKYVVYDWVHFAPVWLRDFAPRERTLMRCNQHGQETYYLSIFDPKTIEWYDHFYKNLHDHFGDRIDDVYACILGPYGEGNYPLFVDAWVQMGHCHEGYWCGDEFALKAFRSSMRAKYKSIAKLNHAWSRSYRSFKDVAFPQELALKKFSAAPERFPAAEDKRRWLDFITWYHQAIIDFAGESARVLLKYYPAEKVRMKPGGSSGGINPIDYGTYNPGYAKMAQRYHIVLQPADCQGAIFADKWMGTAYQFYGVKECTEPASSLDAKTFARRMFSDASSGSSQFFTYEFTQHASDIQKYVHLFRGKGGDTDIAVFCPTTLYRLGGNLQPLISACYPLRDLCEFDVLDELLINDGALTTTRYKALLIIQADIVDQPILDRLDAFGRAGGKIISVGTPSIRNVEGQSWRPAKPISQVTSVNKGKNWLTQLAQQLRDYRGVDGELDGLWTCRRGPELFIYNSKDKPTDTRIGSTTITIQPHTIWFNE